ncbi:hypothetical protein Hanom_Chr13g01205591 [Helianthus anomalus]
MLEEKEEKRRWRAKERRRSRKTYKRLCRKELQLNPRGSLFVHMFVAFVCIESYFVLCLYFCICMYLYLYVCLDRPGNDI